MKGLIQGVIPGTWSLRGRLGILPDREKRRAGEGYHLSIVAHNLFEVSKYCSLMQTMSFDCLILFLEINRRVLNNYKNDYGGDDSYCLWNA